MTFKHSLLLLIWAATFIALVSGLYLSRLSYQVLEEAESYFKLSPLVAGNRKLLGNGFFGRTYRLIQLSSGLIYQGFYIKKGALIEREVLSLPSSLRRRITVPNKVLQVSGFLALGVAMYASYSGVLR
ncbi:hypothetical protein [Pseudomonas mangiferae]|uniref:Uncharacterized protein n=1 Tax=Pseudomonas mangiferae TaxID=2593654 RepID=A0A553GUQ4_9PSED|nr:hypothetical protein [Pseudomonas mangiferae]TRX73248.1 hypothetical protein FM069_18925 [Pseudomonas mangiferae]